MKMNQWKALLAFIVAMGCSPKNPTTIWLARDDSKMAGFLGTTTTNSFYCLELDTKSNQMQVQFLDSDKRFEVPFLNVSDNVYDLTKGDHKRRFVIRAGSVEGHSMMNFLDSRPVDLNNIGGRDASKTEYFNLQECIQGTLNQIEADKLTSTENSGEPHMETPPAKEK